MENWFLHHKCDGGEVSSRWDVSQCVVLPGSKDTSFGGEGTAEAVGQRRDGLRSSFLDAPETNQPGEKIRNQNCTTFLYTECPEEANKTKSLLDQQIFLIFLQLIPQYSLKYRTS